MKQVTLLLLLLFSIGAFAQDEFLTFEDALLEAEEDDKPIMLVFSGSDWCKPCIELKKNILESESFDKVKQKLIYMNLDFPYKKVNKLSKKQTRHNEQLADRYNKQGHFPRVVLVNSTEEVVREVSYLKGMTPEEFIELLKL